MKKLKKLGSMFLALAMALALAIPAMAVSNDKKEFTISIPKAEGATSRTYEVYQIFTGTLATEKDSDGNVIKEVLSDVKWGENGTGTQGTAVDSNTLNTLADPDLDKNQLAKTSFMETYVDFDSDAHATVTVTATEGTSVTLAAGYYLFKETTELGADSNASVSTYIVEVVGAMNFTPKTGTTQFEKKVQDVNDSDSMVDAAGNWQDSADYDIGDEVPFKLTATLANNVSKFTNDYQLIFHDTLSAGLTYVANSVTVTSVDVDNNTTPITTGFNIEPNGNDLTISFPNVKDLGIANIDGAKIVVEYKATLNEEAKVGPTGNENTAYVEFSNDPYSSQTGKTTTDKVVVFTYETVVNKIDKDKNPLQGAGFTLEKYVDGAWKEIKKIETDGTTEFTFTGLDDGQYKLVESKVPAGYNKIEDIYFTISAEHDEEADEPALKTDTLKFEVTQGEAEFTITDGSGKTDVMNLAGVTLPETGGMGTTIFYAVGGVLVLGAVVFLVTKKRVGE